VNDCTATHQRVHDTTYTVIATQKKPPVALGANGKQDGNLVRKGVRSMNQALTLGERIILLRRLNGLTQMELAIALHTDKTYVSRLETDSVKTIKSDSLVKLARLFKVSADYILGITDQLSLEEADARAQFDAEMAQIRERRAARKKGASGG